MEEQVAHLLANRVGDVPVSRGFAPSIRGEGTERDGYGKHSEAGVLPVVHALPILIVN